MSQSLLEAARLGEIQADALFTTWRKKRAAALRLPDLHNVDPELLELMDAYVNEMHRAVVILTSITQMIDEQKGMDMVVRRPKGEVA